MPEHNPLNWGDDYKTPYEPLLSEEEWLAKWRVLMAESEDDRIEGGFRVVVDGPFEIGHILEKVDGRGRSCADCSSDLTGKRVFFHQTENGDCTARCTYCNHREFERANEIDEPIHPKQYQDLHNKVLMVQDDECESWETPGWDSD